MAKIDKISNLNRLDVKNVLIVISYLCKKFFRIDPSQTEVNVYQYYNFLISVNGYFVSETISEIVSDFRNNTKKTIKLRKKPSSDFDVFQQVFIGVEYHKVIEEYKNNFSNYKNYKINIIDAGTNIGLTSLIFNDNFDEPNIVCIEPEKENFKVLKFNLYNYKNIFQINGGLWSSNTYLHVVRDFRDKKDWSFRVEETTDVNDIRAYSIDQICKDSKFQFIDILKIDIEGSEKQIFTAKNVDLNFLKITKLIAIEIHDEFNCRNEIYSILEAFGFVYFNHGELTIGVNQNFN